VETAPIIDRRYWMEDVAEAFRYLMAGRARGKLVNNRYCSATEAFSESKKSISPIGLSS
jgi:hypothetical protein